MGYYVNVIETNIRATKKFEYTQEMSDILPYIAEVYEKGQYLTLYTWSFKYPYEPEHPFLELLTGISKNITGNIIMSGQEGEMYKIEITDDGAELYYEDIPVFGEPTYEMTRRDFVAKKL